MSTPLTPHFTLEELAGNEPVPTSFMPNAMALATLLEAMRSAGGDFPMLITSGFRPNDTGQHALFQAADFDVVGADRFTWAANVAAAQAAGAVPDFGQLLVYQVAPDHHVHASVPGARFRNWLAVQVSVNDATGDSTFVPWDGGPEVPAAGGTFWRHPRHPARCGDAPRRLTAINVAGVAHPVGASRLGSVVNG